MNTKKHPLDEPRIRFNWGYHDGASDVRNNRHKSQEWFRNHFDKVYLQGYDVGRRDMQNGEYTENSTRAWNERRKRGDKSFYNPSGDGLYYVVIPGHGYQETNSVADAKAIVTMFKKEKYLDTLKLVDALDHKHVGGYRLIYEWRRDEAGKWKQRAGTGRVHV